MTEAFSAHFRLRDFNTTFFADHSAIFHALVFTAKAFVVFNWSENLCAEQTVALWFERTVVDRFWLFHFAKRPSANHLWRSQRHANSVKRQWISRFIKKV